MGMYKYLKQSWQDKKAELKPIQKDRLIKWRKQPAVVKIERPTRLDRARSLGYKAKQGFVLGRIRVLKGGRRRRAIPKGRKPSKYGLRRFSTTLNLRAVAEQRINRKFPNLEVLNSYFAGQDGKYVWYEIIMVDPKHPAIIQDKDVSWITTQRKRAYRGLTGAAKRSKFARRKARYK